MALKKGQAAQNAWEADYDLRIGRGGRCWETWKIYSWNENLKDELE